MVMIPGRLGTQAEDAPATLADARICAVLQPSESTPDNSYRAPADVSGDRPPPPRRLRAGGGAAAAGRAERVHLLWSHCVWLTVRGQGGSQRLLNESASTRPEGGDNTDAFVTLLPMGHFSAT